MNLKVRIAKRIADEVNEGDLVNLGIGLPTLVANYLKDKQVTLQSENGMVNMGEIRDVNDSDVDWDITNAGGQPVSILPGGAFFNSSLSFTIIRGGHVDVTVLGAFEVDALGNIASYMLPGQPITGMGGAMDLLAGTKNVIVAMLHTNRNGDPKILKKCHLPLTAQNKVGMIATEMGTFTVQPEGLVLIDHYSDYDIEYIRKATEADFVVSDTCKILRV